MDWEYMLDWSERAVLDFDGAEWEWNIEDFAVRLSHPISKDDFGMINEYLFIVQMELGEQDGSDMKWSMFFHTSNPEYVTREMLRVWLEKIREEKESNNE